MAEKHEKQIAPGDPVAALREQLRNGRASSAGEAAGGDAQTSDRAAGTGIQIVPGNGRQWGAICRGAGGDTRGAAANKRSPTQIPERERPAAGRYGNDSEGNGPSGADAQSAAARTGRLEREDEIPIRRPEPDLPAGQRGKKEEAKPAKPSASKEAKKGIFPWFQEGRPFTKSEAEEAREALTHALGDNLEYIDRFIWWRTETTEPIWSDLSEKELETLVDLMLRRAQRSAAAATMVNAIVNSEDYISALVITVPRTIKMVDTLARAPKKPKRRKGAA